MEVENWQYDCEMALEFSISSFHLPISKLTDYRPYAE